MTASALPGQNRTVNAASSRQHRRGRITLALWGTYLLLIPVYLGSSGQLQIADAALAAVVGTHVIATGPTRALAVPARTYPAIRTGTWFVGYALFVAACWSFILDDLEPLLYGRYFVYGLGLVVLVASLYLEFGDRLLRATRWALYLSLVLVALSVFLDAAPGIRSTGTFNNPNQLGFYALLTQSSLGVINGIRPKAELHPLRLAQYAEGLAWVATGTLAVASASLGAVAGVSLLFVLNLIGRRRITMQVVIAVLLVLPIIAASPESAALDSVNHRFDRQVSRTDGEVGGVLEERGYDRIGHYPQYLIFGAGEGLTDRYIDSDFHGELHSSPGTLLFSYGLIGTMLFGWFLLRTVRGAGIVTSLPLLPVVAYSLSHNGLRFRPWWVLLALLIVAAATSAREATITRRQRRSTVELGLATRPGRREP